MPPRFLRKKPLVGGGFRLVATARVNLGTTGVFSWCSYVLSRVFRKFARRSVSISDCWCLVICRKSTTFSSISLKAGEQWRSFATRLTFFCSDVSQTVCQQNCLSVCLSLSLSLSLSLYQPRSALILVLSRIFNFFVQMQLRWGYFAEFIYPTGGGGAVKLSSLCKISSTLLLYHPW